MTSIGCPSTLLGWVLVLAFFFDFPGLPSPVVVVPLSPSSKKSAARFREAFAEGSALLSSAAVLDLAFAFSAVDFGASDLVAASEEVVSRIQRNDEAM